MKSPKRSQKKRKSGRPSNPLTRDEIVGLALPVFAERGLDGVSMSDVATIAGIRKASLYHHFESKEDLYTAVMDDTLLRLLELVSAARLDEGSFVERIDRLGSLVTDALASRPHTARLLVRELIGYGPYLAGNGEARVSETLSITAAFLAAGMEAGEFRVEDPKQLALSIAAIHLFPFAAERSASAALEAPLLSAPMIEARREAVLRQVRALCVAESPQRPTRKARQ